MLTIANKERRRHPPRSLPSTLLGDLKPNAKIQFCVQEAGDGVFFPARACHGVLSGPGPTSLPTVVFEDTPEEMTKTVKAVAERQATGSRKTVNDEWSKKRRRGQGKRVFSKR